MGDGEAEVTIPVRTEEESSEPAKSWVFSGDASIESGRFPCRLSTFSCFEIETTFDYVLRRAKNKKSS